MKSKRALIQSTIGKWILALVFLALVLVFIWLLKDKGLAILEKLKEFLCFGR